MMNDSQHSTGRLPEAGNSTARVHDISFAGYEGERTSASKAPLILAWWSLLRAFGRRRGWVAKFIPFMLLGFAFMPAVAVLTVRGLFADQLNTIQLPVEMLPYSNYLGIIGTVIILWFGARAIMNGTMKAGDLTAFLLLGDTSYNDGADVRSEYRQKWSASLSREAYRLLRALVMIRAVQLTGLRARAGPRPRNAAPAGFRRRVNRNASMRARSAWLRSARRS